jgi:uncharacterized membrane protein
MPEGEGSPDPAAPPSVTLTAEINGAEQSVVLPPAHPKKPMYVAVDEPGRRSEVWRIWANKPQAGKSDVSVTSPTPNAAATSRAFAALTRTKSGPATTTAAAQPVLGIALGLLAGFTYALYSWGAARVMRCGLPSRPVMGAVFGLGGILLLPVLALTGAPIITSTSQLAVAAYLAIVPMFLGYILFGRGLATVAASTATTVSRLEPAVAALIAVIVLREHLPPMGWLGLGLLFASLVITPTNTRPTATTHLGNRPTEAPARALSVTVNADVEPA